MSIALGRRVPRVRPSLWTRSAECRRQRARASLKVSCSFRLRFMMTARDYTIINLVPVMLL